jgi:Leucine-rich repeat (LRR) protein
MVAANISYNRLKIIDDQPSLTKIIAAYNSIEKLGRMPQLELVDFSHNCITHFDVPDKIKYLSIQFNPMTNLKLGPAVLKSIMELQVNFETYSNIYSTYYQNFEAVSIQTNEQKLEQLIKNLNHIFDEHMARYIYKRFNTVKFQDRESMLHQITLRIYWKYFSKNKARTMEELVASKEFQCLLDNITKFYYRTIVITLYFNGYFN